MTGRKRALIFSVLCMCVASSCSPAGSEKSPPSVGAASSKPPMTCEKLLGEEGLDWIRNNGGREIGISVDERTAVAVDQFKRVAGQWRPGEDNTLPGQQLCRFVVKNQAARGQSLSISYGPSVSELNQPWQDTGSPGESAVTIPVNSDVRLGIRHSEEYGKWYIVRIRCRVSGSAEGQETQVPLEGSFRDTLMKYTKDEEYLRHLLYSARVMVDEVGCENKPVVPVDPPAVPKV